VDEPIRLGVNNKAAKVIRREGGIMNLARALKGTILTFNPVPQADNAVIVVEKATGTRTSIVNWGPRQKLTAIVSRGLHSIWNHFAYVDVIDTVEQEVQELRSRGCTVSADLAGIGESNTDLTLFDYVFVSAEDNYNLEGVKAVVHHPTFIQATWLDKTVTRESNPDIKFTLGAGDLLAATTITHLLDGNQLDLEEIYDTVEIALLEEQWLIS
jgi:hypothetical protein